MLIPSYAINQEYFFEKYNSNIPAFGNKRKIILNNLTILV